MINLLTYKESFLWENSEIPRSQIIRNLNEAILTSKQYGDSHYKTSDFNTLTVSWGNLMEFVFHYGFDEEQRLNRFPWMTQMEHITLVSILSSFKNTTALISNNIIQLDQEFGENKNAYIGFEIGENIDKYVFDKSSLDLIHKRHASCMCREERIEFKEYFIQHYSSPELKEDPNRINKMIKRNQSHPLFERLDIPKRDIKGSIIHGESYQMHFKDRNSSCLNIDGHWKHGGFDLPNEICEILIGWGFILPENVN